MKRNHRKVNTKTVAVFGILIALALVFSYVESQVPAFFAFPGMKLGLTNVVVLTALYQMGGAAAMSINLLRIALVSMLFGGPSAFLYSLAGGMLSTTVMILLKKIGHFRPLTVSIAGGIAHNVGQILTAMVLMNTAGIGWYLCVLWFTGLASGTLIGLLGHIVIRRIPKSIWNGGNRDET